MEKYRIIRYFYDDSKDTNNQVTVQPTNLTTSGEIDAIRICELLTECYLLGNTRTNHTWYRFGYEVDDGKWIIK